ncbi:hypothetical protein R6Q57_005705 [Mikania cordata]
MVKRQKYRDFDLCHKTSEMSCSRVLESWIEDGSQAGLRSGLGINRVREKIALNRASSMGINPASDNSTLLPSLSYYASRSRSVPYETAFVSSWQAQRDISKLKELFSDKESSYEDAKPQIVEITSELEQAKTELSKTNIRVDKYDYSSTMVAKLIDFEIRETEPTGLGYSETDRRFEFTTSSSKPNSLTADPVLTDLNSSDNPEVCVESLSVTSRSVKKGERSAVRSTNCSYSKSRFFSKS